MNSHFKEKHTKFSFINIFLHPPFFVHSTFFFKSFSKSCINVVNGSCPPYIVPSSANLIFSLSTPGLQIYGGPGSLSHDFKIWPITFQGSGPSGPILFSCLIKIFILHPVYELHKTESTCRFLIQ